MKASCTPDPDGMLLLSKKLTGVQNEVHILKKRDEYLLFFSDSISAELHLDSMRSVYLYVLSPALLLAVAYIVFLGDRTDYAGHFMAGFGGTLFWIMAIFHAQQDSRLKLSPGPLVTLIVPACIVFGTLLEATTFRLAKFDEVDYFNQNLGAIMAGISSLVVLTDPDTGSAAVLPSMIIAAIFLFAGFVYAFA